MSQVNKTRVYVQGKQFRQMTANIFIKEGYQNVESLDEADMVVWTGGDDIYPGLYDEKPIQGTYFSLDRDKDDVEAVERAYSQGKFLVGICRGAQLLNVVPNGGKLWQDVNRHDNTMHKAFDTITGKWITLNSVHHQMLRVTDKAEIICWAIESTEKKSDGDHWVCTNVKHLTLPIKDRDAEVVWYPGTKSLLFQAHPEFSHLETNRYFFKLLNKYYNGVE